MRLLIDLNVVLDVLLEREPHVDAASALWAAIESQRAEGLLASHAVTTLFYLVQKAKTRQAARHMVERILTVFGVAPVDQAVLRQAIALACPDFEDAVCAAAAHAAECDAVVTRDVKGFRGAPIRVLDPKTALAALAVLR